MTKDIRILFLKLYEKKELQCAHYNVKLSLTIKSKTNSCSKIYFDSQFLYLGARANAIHKIIISIMLMLNFYERCGVDLDCSMFS